MNFLISFGICSTTKLSKYVTFLAFTYNAIQWVSINLDSARFNTYVIIVVASLVIVGNYFLNKQQ